MAYIPLSSSLNLPAAKVSPLTRSFRVTTASTVGSKENLAVSFSLSSLRPRPPKIHRIFRLTVSGAASVVFRNLDADDFRHPLDRQNTLLLRAVPGLNDIGKALLGTVTEQVMLLENIGTSVLVTENQAVLAHELGHLKCDHGVWLTFANILTLGAYSLPGLGGLIAQRLEEQLLRWLRAAELTCDRAALLVAQDPKVVISVLMKLAGGCPSLADQLNVDAFLEQARSYDKASSSPVGWYIRNAQTRQLSHPLPVLRAREIDEWSRSQEYKHLLTRAVVVNPMQRVAI
ncbi:plastoglobule-localized metallopeptidase 48, chloroplastic isoform X3 [Coffea arabica]|uniref:Plastoglobule-localized metallopeptidase 48, chloroplastic isoform X3 n=1 Tax=Coffea arabica TaxID=13443 RepID=A0ABM4V6L5_COFAR